VGAAPVADALLTASGRGVQLWVEDGGLRFRAPPGALDPELKAALTAAKPALIPALPGPEGASDSWHPLSGSQRGFWFFHQLAPGSTAYHLPFAADVHGPFDADGFAARLRAAVQRHPILRTTIPTVDGVPVQRVHAALEPAIHIADAALETVDDALTAHALGPFDFAAGPLLRLLILQVAPDHHVVALTLHHVVADLSSMSLLLQELTGPPSPIPGATFAAFARDQQAFAAGPEGDAAWTRWEERLADLDWHLPLPIDHPRAPSELDRGATLRVTLPAELAERLEARAAALDATPFALLLTSFSVLLQRMTRRSDFVVGVPVAGRFASRFARCLGPFVDVVPLRLRPLATTPFDALVRATQRAASDALGDARLPFSTLVRRLAPPRDAKRVSTLQVLFAWQSLAPGTPASHREFVAGASGAPVPVGEATWTPRVLETGAAPAELSVTASRSQAGISVLFEYRADLFEPDTVARLAANWTHCLNEVAAGRPPETVTPQERAVIGRLDPDPAGATHATSGRHLVDAFVRIASGHPHHPACSTPAGITTYEDLSRRARELAGALPHGARVALMAPPGPDQLAGVLAILLAGGAFVPLSLTDPPDRLRALCADAGVTGVLASPDQLDAAAALALPTVSTAASGGRSHAPPTPDALAYIAFTSGSTGRPKAVPITIANLVPVIAWGIRTFALGPDRRVLQNLSLAFDFGIFEVLTTVLSGATLCVPDPASSLDARLDFAAAHRADLLHSTPSQARLLLSAGRLLPIRTVHFGGEVLPLGLVEDLLDRMPADAAVFNGYGPTEATINCTIARFDRSSLPELRARPSVPIGAAVAPFRLTVRDDTGAVAPLGAIGELHIGGPCVASGYLGRPDDPAFMTEAGGRLYRTGDLARLMPDGQLLFCGRRDRQVQLRGRRVEPGEIESVFLAHPEVSDAAVDVRDGPGGGRLLAWVVLSDAASVPLVRDHAARRLPAALVPTRLFPVDALPRSTAGKLDRSGLLEPPTAPSAPVAMDALEAQVLDAFRAVLVDPDHGLHDDFFDRGDSLLAVELAHRLGRALARDIPGTALFRASTPKALAADLRALPTGLLPLRTGGAQPPLFIVPPGEFELPALRHLATQLVDDRPILGLAPADAPSLRVLLTRYADTLERAWPAGPVALLGYCVGGQVAHALAGELERRGRAIEVLVLVDAPFKESRLGTLVYRAIRWIVRRVRPRGTAALARYARGLFLDPGIDAHARALEGHTPAPWPGRLVYLMARRSHFRLMPTRARWRRISPGMTFGWLPGNHDSCLHPPHATALAQRLDAVLDRDSQALTKTGPGHLL